MDNYLEFAKGLARQAGSIIRDNFNTTLNIETKTDQSPVTQVDKQINALVIESIQSKYPDHGILGEEADYGRGDERMQWLCDPLDGTKPYILGVPESMFMLALLEDGAVKLSVAYDPYADKMYHAIKGSGAFCNDVEMRVNSLPIDQGYVMLDNSSFPSLDALKAAGGKFQQGAGTGYKCMLLAQGKIIGFMNHKADFHDIGPASLIIEEAGGVVTGIDGNPLSFTTDIANVVASNGVDHHAFLGIAKSDS